MHFCWHMKFSCQRQFWYLPNLSRELRKQVFKQCCFIGTLSLSLQLSFPKSQSHSDWGKEDLWLEMIPRLLLCMFVGTWNCHTTDNLNNCSLLAAGAASSCHRQLCSWSSFRLARGGGKCGCFGYAWPCQPIRHNSVFIMWFLVMAKNLINWPV